MAEVTRVRVELQEQNGRLQAELTAQEALKEKVAALERQLKGELGPEPPGPSRRGSADRWPGCRAAGLSGAWWCGICGIVWNRGACPRPTRPPSGPPARVPLCSDRR